MLDFLVTSKARRRLLQLLFSERASGTVDEFAQRASVGRASAYRELHAMVRVGVAVSTRTKNAEVFAVNDEHPLFDALRQLLSSSQSDDGDDRVRDALFSLGAPTFGKEVEVDDAELALVQGVALAHRDATAASVLPVCLFKQRKRLLPQLLLAHARHEHEERALGFFLDLTTELSGNQTFAEWARQLEDRRRTKVEYLFYDDARSAVARAAAERNTPSCARRWNLRANMGLDAFESMFEKHARVDHA